MNTRARWLIGVPAFIVWAYFYMLVDDWQQSLRPHSFAARFAPAIEMLR